MGWTRQLRRALRQRRRPEIESLEAREMLSTTAGATTASGTVDFSSIIGATQARETYGVDGTGMTVAVIDTGINYDNTALGGGFGPGNKVVAGYDFADNTADPTAVEQHGTAVAGLIASDAPSDPGVAPGADIADLRVFNNDDVSSFSAVASALQWVITNHAQYNITAVNISLTDGGNYQQNWFAQDGGVGEQVTQLIGQLDALNIPVIAAAGNSFTGSQGEAFPAIVPDTISVTATDGSGQLVSDAQRLGSAEGGEYATDLAAPGENLTAPANGNSFATVDGTSFAAPLVTGAVVLLQQIYEQRFGQLPTVSQLDNWLQEGATPIHDPTTGITIGQLDIPASAALIPSAPGGTTTPATTSSTTPPTAPSESTTTTTTPVTIPATTNTNPTTTTTTPAQTQTAPTQTTTTPSQTSSSPTTTSQSTSPPTTPSQTSSSSTTTTPASSSTNATPSVTVSYNGQVTTGTSQSSTAISSLLSVFSNMFGSSGSTTPVSEVSVWDLSTSAGSTLQPAGTVILNAQHPGAASHGSHFRHR